MSLDDKTGKKQDTDSSRGRAATRQAAPRVLVISLPKLFSSYSLLTTKSTAET
jgi:hypothetical protein